MSTRVKSFLRPVIVGILVLFATFFLTCKISYNPALFPSYDVLNPGLAVRLNPLGITAPGPPGGPPWVVSWDKTAEGQPRDGLFVVNRDFLIWTYELKAEVLKLRGQLKKNKS